MQFKLVPKAPESVAYLETVQAAVPLVPGTEDDCCARIMRQTDISPRDEARTWLTFLRALELATEGPSGFHRVRGRPAPTDPAEFSRLRESFSTRVYGVDRILTILEAADEPLSADAVFDRFRESIPQYEQHKHRNRLREIWGERVARILEWAVLFDLAKKGSDGYTVS
ncbi:hypothetical protein OB919_20885 [Halobacteria archaeon AArc-curdl1]|uniref:Uncharacterized protein n=1 Tax=Natronosalvus hydrolyticus TaxID=2979988 RepID=A0AAP2ZBV5_9EURY|nr:hypothetical protein [Halobacteria archaeon AArc-curdl1]